MGLGNFFRDRAFVQGGNILGMAEAFERAGHPGPASRLYYAAHEKLDFGGAATYNLHDIGRRIRICDDKAKAKGEDVSYAYGVPVGDIAKFPDHFLEWYYQQQRGHCCPWHAPTAAELAEEERRAREAEQRERAREEAQLKKALARQKKELEIKGKRLFQQRFEAMLAAAARAADGDEKALREAVSLYRQPSDRKDWGQPWSEYARQSLLTALEKRANQPEVAKALRIMPRVAYDAEGIDFWPHVGELVGFCLLYPISFGVGAFLGWILPDPKNASCLTSLVGLVIGLLALLFYGVAWLLKWVVVPVAGIWIIVLLVYFLPRSLRAKRAIRDGDIAIMKIDTLFSSGDGAPIDK